MNKHICNGCGEEMEPTEDGGWYCEECGWWEENIPENENEEDEQLRGGFLDYGQL